VLELCGVSKSFAGRQSSALAVRDVDLTVELGEFFILLGPSGCGKTTMLRLVAGLEQPDEGEIRIDGALVAAPAKRLFVRPEYRPIAMVFQSYAVWPHMSVYENVAFPLREGMRRLPEAHLEERVREVLALLDIESMADRPATMLSGGQQQRVALARALALRPKILLMDEPLSNLDYRLQTRLRSELKELMHRLALTTIYVTHNQIEAMEMGDRIAVMDDGRTAQIGTPREVYRFPGSEFVARFIGEMTLVTATLLAVEDGFAILDTPLGRMRAPSANGVASGTSYLLGIRPEDVVVADGAANVGNAFEAQIVASRFLGETTVQTARVGGCEIVFKTHYASMLKPGERVRLHVPPDRCVVVAPGREGAPCA
jgi:ABC-type Fe3+/spermidine/putrescine transport system ATPase subunit